MEILLSIEKTIEIEMNKINLLEKIYNKKLI
jgi:hypothetical protein